MPSEPQRPESNPIRALQALGQSVWYDHIHREMVRSGELARLVEEDGLSGVTSNPTIFEKAMAAGQAYEQAMEALLEAGCRDPRELFFALAVEDVQAAADVLRPVHEASGGRDGFVSLEVSPSLAHDEEGTVAEAKRLFRRLGRPNVMIKVPGTLEGVRAFRRLTAAGVHVNVTLLFSVDRYRLVAEAWMAGLEDRMARGEDPGAVRSVASFFVSRVDAAVDRFLRHRLGEAARREGLLGRTAIANAKMAYRHFLEWTGSERWRRLEATGAAPQRLLWASTGTKDPSLSDVHYLEALVGPHTVTTVPPSTYRAFKEHGRAAPTLTEGMAEAEAHLARIAKAGVDLAAVTDRLEEEGVDAFARSFKALLRTLEDRMEQAAEEAVVG